MEQLRELSDEEFEQLCVMIGMNTKPFHILRLKKSLSRHNPTPKAPPSITASNTAPDPATPNSEALSSSSSATNFSNQSLITLPWQLQVKTSPGEHHLEECPLGIKSNASPSLGPSQAFLEAMEACGHNLPSGKSNSHSGLSIISPQNGTEDSRNGFGTNSNKMKTYYLPDYLQDDSKERNFSELLSEHTPIQKTLQPPPFHPSMWDPERKEIIRKYSSVYGRTKRQKDFLNPFEERVNEGAYQLCLRDPTLLVRREELFAMAKRALKESGSYSNSYTKNNEESTVASIGQKRMREEDRDIVDQNHVSVVQTISNSKMITSGSLTDDLPKKLSGRMRQEKMVELSRLISSNKGQQAAKLVELEKAQQLGHFSAAFSIQLEVEALGNTCHQLQASLAALKRKQRRSERYYNLKARDRKGSAATIGGMESNLSLEAKARRELSPNSKGHQEVSEDDDDMEQDEYDRYDHGINTKKLNIMHSPANNGHPTITAQVIPKSKIQSIILPTSQSLVSMPNGSNSENNDQDVQDLVKNVSNATDEVNSLMIREFQKQLEWEI